MTLPIDQPKPEAPSQDNANSLAAIRALLKKRTHD